MILHKGALAPRSSSVALVLAVLASGGCQAQPAQNDSRQTDAPMAVDRGDGNESANQGLSEGANAVVAPQMGTIDPYPVAVEAPQIVSKSDITVGGKPACDFEIRYPGAIEQPVTWNGETCKDIEVKFLTRAELERLGQYADLSEDAKEDITRHHKAGVFYIESTTTASIFPLNTASRIYEVSLAD